LLNPDKTGKNCSDRLRLKKTRRLFPALPSLQAKEKLACGLLAPLTRSFKRSKIKNWLTTNLVYN
jgi:hypothetical protein